MIHIDLIKKKSENPFKILEFIRKSQVVYNMKIRHLRTDGMAEYKSHEFRESLKNLGVEIQYLAPFRQEQNGLVERHIQTLNNRISAMILGSGLPKAYWGEAALYAEYILNRTPRESLNGKTPYEVLTGKVPDIRMIHVVGCSAYRHIPKEQQSRFKPKVELCVLLGIQPNHDAFCLLCLSDLKIVVSRDILFDDRTFPYQNRKSAFFENTDCTMRVTLDQEVITTPSVTLISTPSVIDQPIMTPSMIGTPISIPSVIDQTIMTPPMIGIPIGSPIEDRAPTPTLDIRHLVQQPPPQGSISDKDDEFNLPPPKSTYLPVGEANRGLTSVFKKQVVGIQGKKRISKKVFAVSDDLITPSAYVFGVTDIGVTTNDLRSYRKAISGENSLEWKQAIQDEYEALIKNGTWTLIDRKDVPQGITIHRSIWHLKTKLDGRRKARLCFDGRSQEKGVDYEKVFAPTPNLGSIRAILTMMVEHCDFKVQGDVPNAFLIPPIDVDIYMELPEGYVGDRSKVCKLLKGLYDTKQASQLFYHKILDFLRKELGMTRSEVNPCLFTLTVPNGIVIVLMYVDDIIIGASSELIAQPIIAGLTRKYNVQWSEWIGLFLGIQCKMNDTNQTISMGQPHIVDHLLREYNLENARNVRSSANPSVDIMDDKSPPADQDRYREAIGKLLWIARCTRPDILFRVIQLAQYVSKPTIIQWGAITHLIRYLGATRDYGIVLNQAPTHLLTLYTDSSHGDWQMDRKSVTGYVMFINGGPVDWCSWKQKSITILMAEAEYVAISDSLRDVRLIAMMKRPPHVPALNTMQ